MKLISSLAILAGVTSSVSAYASYKHADPNVVPNRYIVELSSMSAFTKRGETEVDPHAEFHAQMKRSSLPYSVSSTFISPHLLMGATIEVADSDIDQVQAMKSVKAVYPVRLIPRPRPYADKESKIDSTSPANPPDTYSTHFMTGVDRLHNAGIYGAGVLIAEIDTGIDYGHPALGGCFGPGCKVVKGYDFVGDDYTGDNEKIPDDDPMDCSGHGTHVAGIIGANDNSLNFTGVAPAASLAAYRVFGCKGSAGTDVIIEAMIRAANDGADIISMSLGDPAGWTQSIDSVVAQRLVESGIVVSVSQGNAGAEGLFYPSAPAGGLGVISVSSVDNIITPAMVAVLSSDPNQPIATAAESFQPPHNVAFPIYIPDNIQACSPIDIDLAGIVVVAQRGTCTFTVKAENVLNAGGSILLVFNNVAGPFVADFGDADVVGAAITMEDGQRIAAAYAADKKDLTITFPSSYYNLPNDLTPGLTSDFTSYGPTFDQYFSPSVAAPGGNILSTWPVKSGSYMVLSGTSMACPFISGVAALMISANGKMDPRFLRTIIESTAVPVPTTVNGSLYNTVAQQGAGLVDAFAAVHFKTLVSPGQVSLNDTLHAVNSFTVTIVNTGTSSTSYRLSNVPAQAALTFGEEGAQPNLTPSLVAGAAELSFSESYVTVGAGATVDVTVSVNAPQGLDASNVPVFSGFVKIESTDGSEVYSIPYAGTAASLYDNFPIFDTTEDIFGFGLPALVGSDGNPVGSPSSQQNSSVPTFTFAGTDKPELLYRLIGGSSMVYLDLLPADTSFTPTIGGPAKSGPGKERRMSKMVKKAGVPDVGSAGLLSATTYNARNGHSQEAFADPTSGVLYNDVFLSARAGEGFFFASGKKVPNASYRLLVRGLKLFGDVNQEADYESWLSPTFTVEQS